MLKTYLRNWLDSFLLTVGFKQAIVDNLGVDLDNAISVNNGAIAPSNGYFTAQIPTNSSGTTAAFLYNGKNSTTSNATCLFGIRSVTQQREVAIYFSPVIKGRYIVFDGSYASEAILRFYPLKGSS